MVFFRNPAGDNSDHTQMPAATGQYKRSILVSVELFFNLFVRGQIDAAIQTVPTFVQLVDVVNERGYSWTIVTCQKFDTQLSLPQSPRRIQSWPNDKAQIFRCQCG